MLGFSPVGEIVALSPSYSGALLLEWSLMASALSRPGAGIVTRVCSGPSVSWEIGRYRRAGLKSNC